MENRAGQRETARWFPPIVSNGGEEKRDDQNGVEFWCARVSASRVSRSFREGMEGKTLSAIIASTNISKLDGIEESLGKVIYAKRLMQVQYAELDESGKVYTIALEG